MDYRKIITIEPGKMGGKPCIRGMRMTVFDVLAYLPSGMTQDEILHDFPDPTRDAIRACLGPSPRNVSRASQAFLLEAALRPERLSMVVPRAGRTFFGLR